jgi:hypothetical protein
MRNRSRCRDARRTVGILFAATSAGRFESLISAQICPDEDAGVLTLDTKYSSRHLGPDIRELCSDSRVQSARPMKMSASERIHEGRRPRALVGSYGLKLS